MVVKQLPLPSDDLPWTEIGNEFARNVGTTRETGGAWFKNILHRALWLKGKGGVRHVCRSCENTDENENWDHFWRCAKLEPTWKKFIEVANTTMGEDHFGMSRACIFLGIDGSGHALKGTLGLLHKLIWKFIIIDVTKKSKDNKPR